MALVLRLQRHFLIKNREILSQYLPITINKPIIITYIAMEYFLMLNITTSLLGKLFLLQKNFQYKSRFDVSYKFTILAVKKEHTLLNKY